jgi:hypothetical protein
MGSSALIFFREYAWEHIRENEFPTLVSRMDAGFVFEEPTAAENLQRASDARELVYSVALEPSARATRVNMGWFNAADNINSFAGVDELVRRYWRGDDRSGSPWEILTDGAVTVIARLSVIGDDQHFGRETADDAANPPTARRDRA